jgi:hypothetical protein
MRLRLVLAALAASACALASAAAAGQQSIVAFDGVSRQPADSIPHENGVYFSVTTGGGNRSYASVAVECSAAGTVVYSTVLNVLVEPKSAGTSPTIYPPVSSCVASLEKQMAIGKAQILGTTTFTIT